MSTDVTHIYDIEFVLSVYYNKSNIMEEWRIMSAGMRAGVKKTSDCRFRVIKTAQTKERKLYRYIRRGLIAVFAAVFLFSAYKIISYYAGNKESEDFNNELIEQFTVDVDDSGEDVGEGDGGEAEAGQGNTPAAPEKSGGGYMKVDGETRRIDFDSLMKVNADATAWIYCPGTVINYAVATSHDNADYLHTLLNGKQNAGGTLFIDCRNSADFSDNNTVIYGHNMKNGSMFGTLQRYKKQSYYKEHPLMYIYTPSVNYRVEIFAAFVGDSGMDIYNVPSSENARAAYLDYALRHSFIKTDVSVEAEDDIVTLSTCTSGGETERFIVMGKLVPLE